jgi:hypothetical protein
MQTLKQFQKYSTTRIIKFIWRIIYKQTIPNMGVGKSQKQNIKVLMEYKLFEISSEKIIIFLAWLLSKNP